MIAGRRRTDFTKYEEPASIHKEISEEDIHDLVEKDQQTQEATGNKQSHQDVHVRKRSSHQADGRANGETQQY